MRLLLVLLLVTGACAQDDGAALGSPDWAEREAAEERLWRAGRSAVPLLERLAASDDLEVQERARRILPLARWDISPEMRRRLGSPVEGFDAAGHDERLAFLRNLRSRTGADSWTFLDAVIDGGSDPSILREALGLLAEGEGRARLIERFERGDRRVMLLEHLGWLASTRPGPDLHGAAREISEGRVPELDGVGAAEWACAFVHAPILACLLLDRAIRQSPDPSIARFDAGLVLLGRGRASIARQIWKPLAGDPVLRSAAEGAWTATGSSGPLFDPATIVDPAPSALDLRPDVSDPPGIDPPPWGHDTDAWPVPDPMYAFVFPPWRVQERGFIGDGICRIEREFLWDFTPGRRVRASPGLVPFPASEEGPPVLDLDAGVDPTPLWGGLESPRRVSKPFLEPTSPLDQNLENDFERINQLDHLEPSRPAPFDFLRR